MTKNRILFSVWIIFLVFLWVFGNGSVGALLLICSLLCVACERILAWHTKKKLNVRLSASATVSKKSAAAIRITVLGSGFFGAAKLKIRLLFKNRLTGENSEYSVWLSVPGKTVAETEVKHEFFRCGKVAIKIESVDIFDGFGLLKFKKSVAADTAVLVLPNLYEVAKSTIAAFAPDMESITYSPYKPGFDPSEQFSLREYRPGDRLRDIHWKLSQKTDTLTVREASLPVNSVVLLLLNNVANENRTAEMREKLCETLVSLSANLCENAVSHDIGWYSAEKSQFITVSVSSEEELNTVLPSVLSAKTYMLDKIKYDMQGLFGNLKNYAHIVICTDRKMGEDTFLKSVVSYITPKKKKKGELFVEI